MRQRRGYLDLLVETAQPARGVWTPFQPGWGPTRLPEPVAEDAEMQTAPAPRTPQRRPGVLVPAAEPARTEVGRAGLLPPEAPVNAPVVLRAVPAPSSPVATGREPASRRGPDAGSAVGEPSQRSERPGRGEPTVAPTHPARPDDPAPAPVVLPPVPVFPDTQAALQRLDALARRFGALLPTPSEEATPSAAGPVLREPVPDKGERPAVAPTVPLLTAAPRPAPPPALPAVQIGSIEVFVTGPTAPAAPAVAVTAAPPTPVPALTVPAGRLSRPFPGFGFGQG